jgi:hypothetical protein
MDSCLACLPWESQSPTWRSRSPDSASGMVGQAAVTVDLDPASAGDPYRTADPSRAIRHLPRQLRRLRVRAAMSPVSASAAEPVGRGACRRRSDGGLDQVARAWPDDRRRSGAWSRERSRAAHPARVAVYLVRRGGSESSPAAKYWTPASGTNGQSLADRSFSSLIRLFRARRKRSHE